MIKGILFGAGALILAVVGIGALSLKSAMDLDYQSLNEEAQQHFLDGVARGIKDGVVATAGGQADIPYITADAASDLIAFDFRFADPRAEAIDHRTTETMKRELFVQYCNYFAGDKLNDSGVTVKMRLLRPSGGAIASLSFNEETCAPHRKTAENASKKAAGAVRPVQ